MKNNFLNKLNNRKFNGTFRKLDVFENGIDFFSNDYLGFANKSSSIDMSGATGSRLLSGNSNNAGGHSHNVSISGNIASQGVSGTDKNLPPYYALCYIMKS